MIESFTIDNPDWDKVVMTFKEYDVYYLSGYVKAFQIHGDGKPVLIHYISDGMRGICVFMKRKISDLSYFTACQDVEGYTDMITPYGYGGFIFEGETDPDTFDCFNQEFHDFLFENKIVSVFVRFHPQLRNSVIARATFNVIDLGKTIEMDLSSTDVIWSNISSKNRNMIRKAQKSGVRIEHGHNMELLKQFEEIYNGTMLKDNADPYYFFKDEFYESIHKDLGGHYEMFYAVYEDKVVSMAIMLFANRRMHYHLSGSLYEYRSLAASNLMLYEAACWGCNQGFEHFHLGGGIGSHEDNLYRFKGAFNRNSNLQFSIGKLIVDMDMYNKLVDIRSKDEAFDRTSFFFPLYRS